MKKTTSIIKIVLLFIFAAVGIFLSINLQRINNAQSLIENTVNTNVSYFSDNIFVFSKYYKFKDEYNSEYWVRKASGKFEYFYSELTDESNANIGTAIENAYTAAAKWDKSFFSSDTFCQIIDGSEYLFYIHQLDESGYKTGKFIVVNTPGGNINSIQIHTSKNKSNPALGSCISEAEAIDICFDKATEIGQPLQKVNNNLINTEFYNENERWIWSIKIWNITEEEIASKSKAINENEYFICIIDAASGEIIAFD